ncbi:MAG: hypothetical protein R3C44_04320 [Chloroflexota bacterium]
MVALSLVALLLLQRWIHSHLHGISLLATGRADWQRSSTRSSSSPGVLLHEVSHWLAATSAFGRVACR